MMTKGAKPITPQIVDAVESLIKQGYEDGAIERKIGIGKTSIRTIRNGKHHIQRKRAEAENASYEVQKQLIVNCTVDKFNLLVDTLEKAVNILNEFTVGKEKK